MGYSFLKKHFAVAVSFDLFMDDIIICMENGIGVQNQFKSAHFALEKTLNSDQLYSA